MEIKALSVTELNNYVKNKIDNDEYLKSVYIKGEISNCKIHYTGHIYFTLKDEKSLIKCIMFKGYASKLTFIPKDGMKVFVLGSLQVYEKDGVYQIYCQAMKQEGLGELHEAFEKMKIKLEKEGLFDFKNKKSIPKYPEKIGVLTSSTGSVIRDIINVSTRRNPNVNIILLPVPVQGEGAGDKIAKAIEKMNKDNLVDVLIIGRGGGSLEDLWPFNEEIVARAIYNSRIPIISAVGHETDFTISDFVADLRAPTPSAAAELAVPNIFDTIKIINDYEDRYKKTLIKKIEVAKLYYDKTMNLNVFSNPLQKINEKYVDLDMKYNKIVNEIKIKMEKYNKDFLYSATKIDTLSPIKTLTRGYAIVLKEKNVISKAENINKGDKLHITFIDGKIETQVL